MAKTKIGEEETAGIAGPATAAATQERKLTAVATSGPGIGTRFRVATASAASDFHHMSTYEQVAQLTVSSVNTILEDLPETEDEDDDAPRPPPVRTDRLVDVGGLPQSLRQIVAPPEAAGRAEERRTRHPSDSKVQARPSHYLLRRERSPVVSFDEKPPATVIIENRPRPRSRSDATRFIKFRSPTSSFSSSNAIPHAATASPPTPPADGSGGGGGAGGGKMAWLRERRRSVQKIAFGTAGTTGGTTAPPAEIPSEEAACGRDDLVASLESSMADQKAAATRRKLLRGRLKTSFDVFDVRPTKTMRPRTKSDKFDRMATKASKVEVSRAAAFDWPLGRLGKLRQKYANTRSLPKSASEAAMASKSMDTSKQPQHKQSHLASNLKRHNSERNKRRNTLSGGSGGVVRARSVAFEEPSFAQSLWKSSVKFILDKTSGGSRKRHYTDPCKTAVIILVPFFLSSTLNRPIFQMPNTNMCKSCTSRGLSRSVSLAAEMSAVFRNNLSLIPLESACTSPSRGLVSRRRLPFILSASASPNIDQLRFSAWSFYHCPLVRRTTLLTGDHTLHYLE